MRSHSSLVKWDSDMLGKSGSVIWMDLVNVLKETFLDVSSGAAESSAQVLDDSLSLSLIVNFLPKSSWLLVISVWMWELVSTDESRNWIFGPSLGWVFNRAVLGIWLIVWSASVIAVDNSGTISDVRSNSGSVRAVDWNLFVVLSESMSVSIWVREESSLEHLVV